jgi:hypothetical protein
MVRNKKILLGILVVFILIFGFLFQELMRCFSQPFIEEIIGETPEAKVNEYLKAVMTNDQKAAFKIWQLPDYGKEETISLLNNRRQDITKELITKGVKDFKILDIDWWSVCCIPTIINEHPGGAGFARTRVKLITYGNEETIYIFDLFTQKGYCNGLCGCPTRHWTIRDIYQSGQRPLLWTILSWEGKETTW